MGGYHYPDVTQVERIYVEDDQQRMVKSVPGPTPPAITIHTYRFVCLQYCVKIVIFAFLLIFESIFIQGKC